MRTIAISICALMAISCTRTEELDIQGHRGARGLFPENTIPGFKGALDLGVQTLELDVVVSSEGFIVVSHEPWLNPEICLDPEGNVIPEGEGRKWNLFEMTYDSIAQCDCGMRPHPRFPDQIHYPAHKPLLSEVIDSMETHARETQRELPYYNIELKTVPLAEGIWNPSPIGFCALVRKVIQEKGIADRTIIQSFDTEILENMHRIFPQMRISLLVENQDPYMALDSLSFQPDILSPDQTLLTEELISEMHDRGMKVIPWTVNDPGSAKRLIEWGVDGLITDYPDRIPPADH